MATEVSFDYNNTVFSVRAITSGGVMIYKYQSYNKLTHERRVITKSEYLISKEMWKTQRRELGLPVGNDPEYGTRIVNIMRGHC